MQTVGSLDRDYVLVEHGFEYVAKDGAVIRIKPHERYMLLKKTNEHWWQVCPDSKSKPFYVPAKYVKVLAAYSKSPEETYPASVQDVVVPAVEYSYKFLPSDLLPKASANPDQVERASAATSVLQPANAHSLCDIALVREGPDPGDLFQDKSATGGTLAPLRTFHNSRKFLDPLKRTSLMFPPGCEPSIRSSQSLNDLHVVRSDPAGPYSWTPEAFPGNLLSSAMPVRHTAGAGKEADEEEEEAVYVNLRDLQIGKGRLRSSSQQHSSASTIDDWETHTDQSSGQHFYYNSVTGESTWDCPLDQVEDPLQLPITPTSLSPAPEEAEWQKHFDESSGQFYFYNPLTGETSWDPPAEDNLRPYTERPMFSPYGSMDKRPPTPEADYPDYAPKEVEGYPAADYDGLYVPSPPHNAPSEEQLPGWSCQVKNGQKFYINNQNGDKWFQSEDEYGKTYFYTPDGSASQWKLPQLGPPDIQRGSDVHDDPNSNIVANWRPKYAAFSPEKVVETPTKGLEKAGVLHKTKLAESGKRLRKNWSSSWTVLEGGILTFFKDTKNMSSNSLRQSLLTTPEHTVKLHGASLGWASKEKSSKKHVMELRTQDGCEYLIHHDSEAITTDWFMSISKSIGKDARISCESTSENESEAFQEFGSTEKLGMKDEKEKRTAGQNNNNSDSDRNVRAKLRKFLQRRPTLQSLKDKGYIRDQLFGCHLHQLCEREKRNVPQFVCKSIQAVEKRGLDIDGLYRISGNLAVIQKLRYKADHDENLNLEDGKWEDVHVITGALKLFFRELPEPLFPYSHFNDLVETIKLGDQNQKIRRLRELILSLPTPNLDTMRLLFRHLCSVIEHKESNRMSVQSIAIVFGPTLLRPEEEGNNIAMYMVFQNQIVEQILIHYKYIFSS